MNLIFDLDGTLIDSVADIHAAVARILSDEGREPLPPATIRSFVGEGPEVLIRRVIAATGAEETRLIPWHRAFLAHYEAAPVDRTEVLPGARAALVRLREAGHRLAICTNKPGRAAGLVLEALDLASFFDLVLGGDALPERKPSGRPLLYAADRLGGGATVYLGDSEIDAAAAAAARLPFGLYLGGYCRVPLETLSPAFAFAHFDELDAHLARHAERA